MMQRTLFAALGHLLSAYLWCQEPSASVCIQVLSFVEDSLEDASVELLDGGTNEKFKLSSKDGCYVGTGVPYGAYTLHVRRPGFRSHGQSLLIFQEKISLRVFLFVSRISDEAPAEVTGSVTPAPSDGERLWIKMLPLLSTDFVGETEVGRKGEFRIVGLDDGEYVLVVMKGKNAIYMKQVGLYGELRVKLNLTPNTR